MLKGASLLIFSLSVVGCRAASPVPDIRALCADTVNAYAHARDVGDKARAEGLFTEDATVTLFGNTQNGREEILDALAKRAEGAVSRHIIGSVVITPTGADTAKGESYVMLVAAEDTNARPLSLTQESLLAVGTYEDDFRIEDGTCRIAARNVVIDFQAP